MTTYLFLKGKLANQFFSSFDTSLKIYHTWYSSTRWNTDTHYVSNWLRVFTF